jgi:hypothetical protein
VTRLGSVEAYCNACRIRDIAYCRSGVTNTCGCTSGFVGGWIKNGLSSASWWLLLLRPIGGPKVRTFKVRTLRNCEFVRVPEREFLAIPEARSGTLT